MAVAGRIPSGPIRRNRDVSAACQQEQHHHCPMPQCHCQCHRPKVAQLPPNGPHPIGAAMKLACVHAAMHPLQQYFQVTARGAGIEVTIQSRTFAVEAAFWAKYGTGEGCHKTANSYQELVIWIEQRDKLAVADGLLKRGTLDQDCWWVIHYPEMPDMATLVEGL